ncbi:MAG: cadherin-like domain-containing protein, partial [Desulfobulbaceae bacterium]|nr:cadherin-like domain-containing protein [Desulfobulbaceae bacterium]
MYYKTGSSGPPYDGTGITEGPSPVTAGNVTTITLHGLSDTETYYFALTAYLGSEESPYSTEIVLLPASPGSTGRDISFVWTANAETVDGYRLYYKTGSSGPPYDGTGISESSSPVATGNVTGFTLHGLSETDTYYFALTAYRGTEESGFSDEIMLPPSQVNSPPVALDVALAASENTPLTGQLPASDPDNDPLTYTIVSNGVRGSAVITDSTSGAFTYTPNTNVTGSDSFTFKVNDGAVDSAAATVSVAITAV